MGTSLLVSEEGYLNSSYEPDCEYDAGVLLERNQREQPHGLLQGDPVARGPHAPHAAEDRRIVPLADLFAALDE